MATMNLPKKILIADDDRALVDLLTLQLQHEGYEVIQAGDGCRALAQALRQKPDLLVLDIHMPFGSGFNVQEHIYKLSRFDEVPVIYISGDNSAEARATAQHFGAYALITKPFTAGDLLATVRRALSQPSAAA
jgi:DNA-binding response OmpR family regulator